MSRIKSYTFDDLERLMEEQEKDETLHALAVEDLQPLIRYIDDRIEPGGFLYAVLCNDLKGACARADLKNRRRIFEYVQWLYRNAPFECWGSSFTVNRWLKRQENDPFEEGLKGLI